MRLVVFAALGLLLNIRTFSQTQFTELELISFSQLQNPEASSFELSGMVRVGGKYYLNADGPYDNYIYEMEFIGTKWQLTSLIPLRIEDEIDLEALDYCNGVYYLANEENGKIYYKSKNGKTEQLTIDFNGENPSSWKNAGWEGLAIDCSGNMIYLVKERQPRKIFRANLSTKKVEDTFNIPETESNDFADAKFENGFLYLIERNGNYVTKVDPKTHEVVDKLSYKQTCSHERGKLYSPTAYGMAESLLLTKDEIWLGLDNNGLNVSDYAIEKFGLEGAAPIILKFKRPEGF